MNDRNTALRAYVQHRRDCPQSINVRFADEPGWVTSSYSKPCTCGLSALLAEAESEHRYTQAELNEACQLAIDRTLQNIREGRLAEAEPPAVDNGNAFVFCDAALATLDAVEAEIERLPHRWGPRLEAPGGNYVRVAEHEHVLRAVATLRAQLTTTGER